MKNHIQKVRWEKNWSQAQLARKSGVPQSVICSIENKDKEPLLSTALKLAKALSINVEELFFIETKR